MPDLCNNAFLAIQHPDIQTFFCLAKVFLTACRYDFKSPLKKATAGLDPSDPIGLVKPSRNVMKTFLHPTMIAQVAVLAMLTSACDQSSSPPPPVPHAAIKGQDSGTSGGGQNLSPLAQLSASGDGNVEVRNRQLGSLKSQRDSYVNQLVTLQSFADQLFSTDTDVQQTALRSIEKTSLKAGAAGSAVAVGGGAIVGALTGDWAGALLATLPTAATLIGNGTAADSAQAKEKAATATISAELQAQRDLVKEQLANLQAKIAALDAQIDSVNAVKL